MWIARLEAAKYKPVPFHSRRVSDNRVEYRFICARCQIKNRGIFGIYFIIVPTRGDDAIKPMPYTREIAAIAQRAPQAHHHAEPLQTDHFTLQAAAIGLNFYRAIPHQQHNPLALESHGHGSTAAATTAAASDSTNFKLFRFI